MINGPSKVPTQWATQAPVSVGWMRQFSYMAGLYAKIRNVPGDIVECGLGEGNTFAMLAYLLGSSGDDRILLGFDSFKGWPEPTEFDESPRHPQKGEWKVSENLVRERLEASKINEEFPKLHKVIVSGFFADSLRGVPSHRKIAFLHLDCDLYASYRDTLEYLFPKVEQGGVVAFDEYREFPDNPEYGDGKIEKWPGASKAIDDYFKRYPQTMHYHPEAKKYYVIKA